MKLLGGPLSRPVATGAWYVALLLVGVASLRDLPVGLTPDLDLPRLTVSLVWPNASSTEMEALVTAPTEAEAEQLRDVEEIASVSGPGWSQVQVAFSRGTDLDLAEVFLRERLAAIRDELPVELAPPAIQRTLPRGMEGGDFLVFQAWGPYTAESLRRLLEERVLPRLLAVPGVAGSDVYGGTPREIHVGLDRDAVERGLISPAEMDAVLARVGGTVPLGAVRSGGARLPAVLERPEPDVAAIADAFVTTAMPIRVADVARVRDGWAEPTRLSRLDGVPSVQVVLEREPGTNVISVAENVLSALDDMRSSLPEGVTIETIHDQSERVRDELDVLVKRSLLSIGAIFLVMVAFHRRVRAPLVVLTSVVFSALATFLLFRLAGLGMNLVTLSGLALAFGMAVDNAIVILENVALRRRAGADSRRGLAGLLRDRLITLAATREVLFPLMAATFTTAVVLMPFLYLSGDLKDYYLPFVLAVCLSLLASMGVALTLTPLLSRWGLDERPLRATGALAHVEGSVARRTSVIARAVLRGLLRWPIVPVGVALSLLVGSLWVFQEKIPTGSIFPPNTDTSLRVSIEFPPGGEIRQADALIRAFEEKALSHEYVEKGYVTQVETYVRERSATTTMRFHPGVVRTAIPEILRDEMTLLAAGVSGVKVSVQGRGPGYSAGGASVSPTYQLRLEGPDYLTLSRLAEDLGERLERNARIKNVDANLTGSFVEGAVQLAAVPDRSRIAELGVSMPELMDVVRPAIASDLAGRPLRTRDGELEARVAYAGRDALTPAELVRTLVHTDHLAPFPLGEVLEIEERPTPSEIWRRNQQYSRSVGFEYRGPRKIGNEFVQTLVENTTLPPGYTLEEGLGVFLSSREEREIHLAIALAILLVYMVSAALFESLLLPFVAIVSVPLSFIGVVSVFWITGASFDRTAYVGLILLAGIAINNALLLVHRAGRLARRAPDARAAITLAVSERARPILMTTATSVAGLVPLGWGVDPNATAGWRSLAMAGTGGLIASAIVTLVCLPPLFVLLQRRRRRPMAPSRSTTS